MAGEQRSLLLVEDDSDDAALCLRAIAACGVPCKVRVITHGGEALGLLLSPTELMPDLVVLDYHLPGANGIEMLRQLRKNEKTRHLPIVMLSSLASSTQLANCLNEGANSCVIKPVDPHAYQAHVGLLVRYWLTVHQSPEPG